MRRTSPSCFQLARERDLVEATLKHRLVECELRGLKHGHDDNGPAIGRRRVGNSTLQLGKSAKRSHQRIGRKCMRLIRRLAFGQRLWDIREADLPGAVSAGGWCMDKRIACDLLAFLLRKGPALSGQAA